LEAAMAEAAVVPGVGQPVARFPVGIEKSDYVLVNLDTYPWRNLPDVTLTRDGSRVTIVAGGLEHRYEVAAQGGPHLLLRRL